MHAYGFSTETKISLGRISGTALTMLSLLVIVIGLLVALFM